MNRSFVSVIAVMGLAGCATQGASGRDARDPDAVRRSVDLISKRPPDFGPLYQCGDERYARSGTVVLAITVGSLGHVESVQRREGTDMPDEVVRCMIQAAQWLPFPTLEVDHVVARYRFVLGGGATPSVVQAQRE